MTPDDDFPDDLLKQWEANTPTEVLAWYTARAQVLDRCDYEGQAAEDALLATEAWRLVYRGDLAALRGLGYLVAKRPHGLVVFDRLAWHPVPRP